MRMTNKVYRSDVCESLLYAAVIPDLIGNPEEGKLILDSRFRENDGKRAV